MYDLYDFYDKFHITMSFGGYYLAYNNQDKLF